MLHEVSWSELAAYSPLLHLEQRAEHCESNAQEIAILIAGTLVDDAAMILLSTPSRPQDFTGRRSGNHG